MLPAGSVRDHRQRRYNAVSRDKPGCFAVLRQLRSIRRSLPDSVFQSLVVALVMPRLDYGNATLAGLPVVRTVYYNRFSMLQPG